MEANWPQKKEFRVHSERFVDLWIEKTFICIPAAFFNGSLETWTLRRSSSGASSRQLRPIRHCREQ